jgi:hypothetical protein
MIICLHYLGHGGALDALNLSSFNFYPVYLLECLSIVAVNGFILISGYYKMNFNFRKLFDLYTQVFFYSVVISAIFWLLKIEPITIKEILRTVFPLVMGRWWFISIYILLFLLSPFINLALSNMDKKVHEQLIIILLIFNVILPSLNYTYFQDGGYGIENFIFLYCVGDYIRKYDIPKLNYILIYFASCFVLLGIIIFFKKYDIHINRLLSYNFILTEISAINLFLFFKNIKIQSLLINKVAASVFAIYLISDHPYIRNVLYTKILFTAHYYYSTLFIPHMIASLIAIFVCCLFLELIRQRMLIFF